MQVLVIFVITILIAGVVHFAFERWIRRMVRKTKTSLDDKIIDALKLPLVVTVLVLGGVAGVRGMGEMEGVRRIVESGAVTVLAVLWGVRVVDVAVMVVMRVGKRMGHATHFLLLCSNFIKIVIWSVVLLLVLSSWGINITPLLASAGIAGLALGLGAQETLSNIFGGIAIILDKPYKVKDFIVVQNGQEILRGEVLDIGMRSTKIRTRDNVYLTIPNSVMANSVIVNETGKEAPLRVRIKVGVAYDSDITKVEQVLLKAVYEIETGKKYILDRKGFEPKVRFREFGDSALLFELLIWIKEPGLKGEMIHLFNKAVLEALRREEIEIPFPQRDIHLRSQVK